MNRKALEAKLQAAIEAGAVLSYSPDGPFRYNVYVSGMFADGDHPVVLLEKRSTEWWFTDQGNTLGVRLGKGTIEMALHLSYHDCDFHSDLRLFVDALLAVDAAMRKNVPSTVPGADVVSARAGKP